MTNVDFDQYSEQSIHFFSRRVPKLLAKSIELIGPGATLVDVGCGDGHLVWALSEAGHISPGSRVFGVDISPIRLRRFHALTGFQGIMADGHRIPALETGCVDLALSTMVIEHVPDDLGHVCELARITRPGGIVYLSTVIRKRGAWYFRKAPDGRRVLDPTHLREYPSVSDVTRLIEAGGFVISEQRLSRLIFPIAHPLVRWLHARRPIKDVQQLFLKRFTGWLEILALPIPRYREIEIVAKRVSDPVYRSLDPSVQRLLMMADTSTQQYPATAMKEQKPHLQTFRILVVIPTLGERLETLCRALSSLQVQADVLVDVVLVSKIKSIELSAIADRFSARIIFHPGNISAAVNAGFAQATEAHRYVSWLGDDDFLRPNALAQASALLELHPRAVLVYSPCDYVDINGKLLFNRSPPLKAPALLQFVPGLIKQETCLFRLSAVQQVGGLNEKLKYTMDLDLLLRLRRLGPFVKADKAHAAFCWHPGSITIANRYASLIEAQEVQRNHAQGIVRMLHPLWKYPIRYLFLTLNWKINRGLQSKK